MLALLILMAVPEVGAAGPQLVVDEAPEPAWPIEVFDTGLRFPQEKAVRTWHKAMPGQVFKSGTVTAVPELMFFCAAGGGGGRGVYSATAGVVLKGLMVDREVQDPRVVTAWLSYDGRQPVAMDAWVAGEDRSMVQLDGFDPVALAKSGQVMTLTVSLPIDGAGVQRVTFDMSGWTQAKAAEMVAVCPR